MLLNWQLEILQISFYLCDLYVLAYVTAKSKMSMPYIVFHKKINIKYTIVMAMR